MIPWLVALGGLALMTAAQGATIVALLRARRRHRETVQQLADSERRREEIQKLAHVGDWEYDLRDDRIHWSEETFRIFGIPPGGQEPDFADVLQGIHPEDGPRFDRAMQQAISAGISYNFDLRIRCADGQEKYINAQGSPVFGPDSQAERIIGTILDITDRKLAEQVLVHNATYDALTGLVGRRSLLDSLESAIAAARRTNTALSLCLCDLDRFKNVNDTYGHAVGDELLIAFSQILREGTRASDVPGRLGGDEFCVILPGCDSTQAAACVERIRVRFAQSHLGAAPGPVYTASATFGIAELEPAMNAADLLEAADRALYQAKELGRNCSMIFSECLPAAAVSPRTLTQREKVDPTNIPVLP
jgi:diguanylate cyclase (GGDEF)-like protein/PAS domain S-box-containing protein